ncbi:hypothetical protein [Ktedonospora formicarum]|uniref:Uncharacterized protein n=1 Tax=Ktedonospora formicarum TaxID=2778364 RepID=A0A8J3I8J7_9CHLR|nr:hypothetical protein [Ktedonospora formicarum]GHO46659.1 hypothetical protein KSX_48220 [Ktedonospora formicarum]
MPIPVIANLMSIPIALVTMAIAIRALFMYRLSRSDMLLVLGLAMGSISIATLVGSLSDSHIGGTSFTGDWARAFGACCGALFIYLSSLVKSHEQMLNLVRWQALGWILFIIVILCTPLYPPIQAPWTPLILNLFRMIIYSLAFVRYASLYATKSTRFSMIMSVGFFILIIGYALNIPGYFQSGLIFFTIIAASVRIVSYLTLFWAYNTNA